MKEAIEYINTLIKELNYTSYCEIGYARGDTFAEINCAKKIAIDPDPLFERAGDTILRQLSDAYFAETKDIFDIYFIDGDHTPAQVFKDIHNCFNFLSPRGVLVLHDVCPINAHDCNPRGCDEAYKAFLRIRAEHSDISAYIVEGKSGPDIHGYGIMFKQPQKVWNDPLMVYEHHYMHKNKQNLMQPRTIEQIVSLLKERNNSL